MRQTILIFSAIAGSLLILLNLRKLSVLSADGDSEMWTVAFAAVFILIGVVLSRYISTPSKKSEPADHPVPEVQLKKLGITQREYEVLRLITDGHSNQEISGALFISESTVKTHVSNVLVSWMQSAEPRQYRGQRT